MVNSNRLERKYPTYGMDMMSYSESRKEYMQAMPLTTRTAKTIGTRNIKTRNGAEQVAMIANVMTRYKLGRPYIGIV